MLLKYPGQLWELEGANTEPFPGVNLVYSISHFYFYSEFVMLEFKIHMEVIQYVELGGAGGQEAGL